MVARLPLPAVGGRGRPGGGLAGCRVGRQPLDVLSFFETATTLFERTGTLVCSFRPGAGEPDPASAGLCARSRFGRNPCRPTGLPGSIGGVKERWPRLFSGFAEFCWVIIILKLFTFFVESRFSGQKNWQAGFFLPGCGPKRGVTGTPTGAGRGRAQGVTALLDRRKSEKLRGSRGNLAPEGNTGANYACYLRNEPRRCAGIQS